MTGAWNSESAYGPFGSAVSGKNGAVAKLTVYRDSESLDLLYLCMPDSTPFTLVVDSIPHPVGRGDCRTPTYMKETIATGNFGWHWVEVDVPNSGKAYIWGLSAETGNDGVLVNNISQSGRRLIDLSPSTDSLGFLDVLAPTLTIVSLGMNDIGSGVPLDQYEAALSRLVAYASRFGAVIVVSENPRKDADTLNPHQSDYVRVNEQVARAAGVMYVDMYKRWGEYSGAVNRGLISSDGYHPTSKGHLDYAAALWEQLWHPTVRPRMR